MFRIWVEESYFQPVGQRTLSNQALYQDKNVIVIYTSIRSGTIKMINYVKNRALAVATEILVGLNIKTDINTHDYMKKQVVLLNWQAKVLSPSSNCQAQVQVPNSLSQQAPNPGPKVKPSLKNPKTQFFGLG